MPPNDLTAPDDVHSAVLAGIDHQITAAELAPTGPWHIGNAVDPTRPVNVHTFPDLRPVADQVTWLAADHIVAQDPQRTHAALIGRRRILERHAPHKARLVSHAWTAEFGDYLCRAHTTPGRVRVWPCDDYRDAAADLFPLETS